MLVDSGKAFVGSSTPNKREKRINIEVEIRSKFECIPLNEIRRRGGTVSFIVNSKQFRGKIVAEEEKRVLNKLPTGKLFK